MNKRLFFSKVNEDGPVMPGMETPCHVWTGRLTDDGYGLYHCGEEQLAHRVAWVIEKGPIPEGVCILHRCDNRACVRDDHLFEGNRTVNNADRDAKGRQATGERHGSRTHPERVVHGDQHAFRKDPSLAARGEQSGRSKIKEADVLAIRRRYKEGASQSALAREYGLSSRNVGAIVHGESWKHLPL